MLPHTSHATHASDAEGATANGRLSQPTGYEARLRKVPGILQPKLIVQVHCLVADRFLGDVNVPAQ
jgi:hypothetical protein